MALYRSPPSQTWRSCLAYNVTHLVAVDVFTVPTVLFNVLCVFVILNQDRRRRVHFNVTALPTTRWTAQQLVEAFPWDTAPRYLLRDRDGVYERAFFRRAPSLEIREVKTAPQSPWQHPYAEPLIGTLRRECPDHTVVLNGPHIRRALRDSLTYYHGRQPPSSVPTPGGVSPYLRACTTQADVAGLPFIAVSLDLHPPRA